jgi:lambda family phage portal protein
MLGIGARLAELRARRAEAELRVASAEAQTCIVRQGFDAARRGGRAAGWHRPLTSATTEIQPALPWLRATARDLVRNSPHASRAIRVLTAHIAGTGMRPRAQVEAVEPDAREAIQRVTRDQWDRFVERCDPAGQLDWYGQQRLLTRAVVEGGEALRIWTPITDGGRLFWRCSVVEGDLLDHQKFERLNNGGKIVQGVEFDATGRRVAYHLLSEHPGERYSPMSLRHNLQRIPAEFVDHAYDVLRPGQVRGVSWFAPAATVLRDIDDLAEAEVVRKKLEACISMVVTSANDDGTPLTGSPAIAQASDDSGTMLTTSDGAPIERLRPGVILKAQPGWSVDFNAPPASEGLVDHMQERLHAVAAGIGVTYMQMTGDTMRATYSSMREGRIEFTRLIDGWQADLMVQQTGRPAWRRVMNAAIANGDLRQPSPPRARFVPPKRPWVDPQKDAAAAIMQMEAFIRDPQSVVEETGEAPEDVIAGISRWRDLLRASGLSQPASAAPSGTENEDDDDSETNSDDA